LVVEQRLPVFAHDRVTVDRDAVCIAAVRVGVNLDAGEVDAPLADRLSHPGLTGAEGHAVRPRLRHLRRH
jgi:hypothetical protein